MEKNRRELNKNIRAYVKQQQAKGDWSLYLLNLEKKLDWHNMPRDQRDLLFDDGLHLTEPGYKQLGEWVTEGLTKIMKV